jgi:hypothetical protein
VWVISDGLAPNQGSSISIYGAMSFKLKDIKDASIANLRDRTKKRELDSSEQAATI